MDRCTHNQINDNNNFETFFTNKQTNKEKLGSLAKELPKNIDQNFLDRNHDKKKYNTKTFIIRFIIL